MTDTSYRINSLDGLRGFAACMVVLAHFSEATHSYGGLLKLFGATGVLIFFSLSGYLMGHLYMSKRITYPLLKDFSIKRFARVVPLFWLIVLLSFGLHLFDVKSTILTPINSENFLENFFFWKGRGILWTIPVEIQFYLIFPIIWLAFNYNSQVTIIGALTLALIVVWLGYPKYPVLFDGHIIFFIGGVIASTVKFNYSKFIEVLFVVLLALSILTVPDIQKTIGLPRVYPVKNTIFYLLGPLIVLVTAHSKIASFIFGNAAARFLGTISYSIYLLHLVAWGILASFIGSFAPPMQHIIAFLATLAIASLSYYYFESPLRVAITNKFAKAKPAQQPTGKYSLQNA